MEDHRLVAERKRKLDELRQQGINPFPHAYTQTHHAAELQTLHAHLHDGASSGERVSIAGRLMLLREMGKIAFGQLQDATGRIQVLFRTGAANGPSLSLLDLGDFLGVEGDVVKTKTGEITVQATTYTLLAKSLRPLPDKFHGLQENELKYRKRYLDLLTDPQARERFTQRATIIKTIRQYLDEKKFLEVETPTLQPVYGGASARPFTTHHNTLDLTLYLRISDELYLKRLLVGGFERVYEICKDFRNEGIDTSHNPEFTMLEWYMAYGDYETGMRMFEEIVAACAIAIHGTSTITYQGTTLNLTPPWRRATMVELIKEHAKVDVLALDEPALRATCAVHKADITAYDPWGMLVQRLFEATCEEHLVQPTFVIDHPIETTPLCKPLRTGDTRFVERFEPFIAGMEVGNAYSELNDPILQKQLFEQQHERKSHGDDEAHPTDTDFVEAMEHGMPPTSGVGLGVDRIVMLLTDSPSIRDVIFFPTMRPQE